MMFEFFTTLLAEFFGAKLPPIKRRQERLTEM